MAKMKVFILATLIGYVCCFSEQGIFEKTLHTSTGKDAVVISKSMYNRTVISVTVDCGGAKTGKINVKWLLRFTPCAEEYIGLPSSGQGAKIYLETPQVVPQSYGYKEVFYKENYETLECGEHKLAHLKDVGNGPPTKENSIFMPDGSKNADPSQAKAQNITDNSKARVKRADPGSSSKSPTTTTTVAPTKTTTVAATSDVKLKPGDDKKNKILPTVETWEDGTYLFVLVITNDNDDPDGEELSANVTVWMKGPHGYLSAIEWPLLPFFGVMCFVYILLGILWMVLTFCNWRDLLRIQFWIGGVLLLGLLEKAVFFAEFESINTTGKSVRGALIFAELVSCLKRAVARMLVIIVSLGFGIVKPRLGPMLHRVLGVGFIYFIFASIEGCMRTLRDNGDQSKDILFAGIALAITDAAICWWIFTSLVQTTRTLRLRRNLVKLSLYRHFTNTLIFAVLASVAFMIWSMKQHKMVTCLTDWKEIWVDNAFWHLLFSVVLTVIMLLWRPTNNNQRYAFSPLLDAAEDEDEDDMVMNDAFEGMKNRSNKGSSNGNPKQKDTKTEDDLKWIDENIPSSITDTALPSLLDSDEEIMTTKFEMSKME